MNKYADMEAKAIQTLGIDTLETRRADSLDFHDMAVWTLRKALREAFDAGAREADRRLPEAH